MSKLVIIGSGGFAKELAWLWQDCRDAGMDVPELIGFISNDESFNSWNGIPVLGNDSWAGNSLSKDTRYLLGIGNAALRQKLASHYHTKGFKSITLVHPSARIGSNTRLGAGTIICAGCTLTVDIQIGSHVLCNLHCTIGHDTTIGDSSVLSPGVHLSGNSTLQSCVEMGTGSLTLPRVSINSGITVGAGAVVTKDLVLAGTYVGTPARKVR